MRRLIFLSIIVFLASCGSGYMPTPPIATPNETLPLYQTPQNNSIGGDNEPESPSMYPGDAGDQEGEPTVYIEADPNDIDVYSSGANYNSKITVLSGYFAANSMVDVFGLTPHPDDVTSPPMIYEDDLDETEEKIQLLTEADGSLEFWLRAGNSAGTFYIQVLGTTVSGTTSSLYVRVTISD